MRRNPDFDGLRRHFAGKGISDELVPRSRDDGLGILASGGEQWRS